MRLPWGSSIFPWLVVGRGGGNRAGGRACRVAGFGADTLAYTERCGYRTVLQWQQ